MDNTIASLSTYSIADLGRAPRGALHFPGRAALPPGTAGYVRSAPRARIAAFADRDAQLPWRDYPPETLTPTASVLAAPFAADVLLIGCRNVLNEWGYQLRLGGTWWRRAGDPPVDDGWPVLTLHRDGARFVSAAEGEGIDADLLTGVPLVIGGVPSPRPFLIANCSDVAHVFCVHPSRGPYVDAWLELSNAWETAHHSGMAASELAATMDAIAQRHGVSAGNDYLHSIMAETADGRLMAVALTGSVEAIAAHLAGRCGVSNAILLDNGGSVGWFYCQKGTSSGVLLVGAPHRRDRGTAFLSIETGGFPRAVQHPALE